MSFHGHGTIQDVAINRRERFSYEWFGPGLTVVSFTVLSLYDDLILWRVFGDIFLDCLIIKFPKIAVILAIFFLFREDILALW